MFFKKLYVRIWLAVVLAVAVLTLLVGWAWRMAQDPPLREVVIRNEAGQVIGNGQSRRGRAESAERLRSRQQAAGESRAGHGANMRRAPVAPDDATAQDVDADVADAKPGSDNQGPDDPYGRGPQFVARMADGQTLHLHLPMAAPSPWTRAPFGFFWTLALVGVAVALGTYPIVRKLTRRLERLQLGVEKWGAGDLSARMPVTGQDEVAFLAERFNHAAERIQTLVTSHETLLASQKSLLANASHELRSPLTRIRMGLELMGDGSGSSASVANWKPEIARNIAELDQLIDEILLASRLDAREADLGTVEPVDLVGLTAEECARVQAELEVQTGDASEGTLAVKGVTKLLRRAVRNLLENARRHGAGRVSVQLGQFDGFAEISVSDQGPGVPLALRERIFEPFYRLPGATERDGGVGLGLALVKSIAERHGGTVHCEDGIGGGARFVLRLPMST